MTTTTSTRVNEDGELVVACSAPMPAGWTEAEIEELGNVVAARLMEAIGNDFLHGVPGANP